MTDRTPVFALVRPLYKPGTASGRTGDYQRYEIRYWGATELEAYRQFLADFGGPRGRDDLRFAIEQMLWLENHKDAARCELAVEHGNGDRDVIKLEVMRSRLPYQQRFDALLARRILASKAAADILAICRRDYEERFHGSA